MVCCMDVGCCVWGLGYGGLRKEALKIVSCEVIVSALSQSD